MFSLLRIKEREKDDKIMIFMLLLNKNKKNENVLHISKLISQYLLKNSIL